jgi:hypothetical protein
MFPRHRLQFASMLLASGSDARPSVQASASDTPLGAAQLAYLAKAAGAIPVVDGAEIYLPLNHGTDDRWLAYVAERLSARR